MNNLRKRRLILLDQLFRSPVPRSMVQCMEALSEKGIPTVSDRTFQTDCRDLETCTGGIIAASETATDDKPGYCYRSPMPDSLDFGQSVLTPEHLQALYLARDALKQSQGIPEADLIDEAIQILKHNLYELGIGLPPDRVHEVVRFSPTPIGPVNKSYWQKIYQAIDQGKRIQIRYQNGWKKPAGNAWRKLLPYRIVNLRGEWYLLAAPVQTPAAVRQYHFSRIHGVLSSSDPLSPPAGVDIDERLRHVFANFIGDPMDLEQVTLRFSHEVRPIVEGHFFHPEQKVTPRANGDIEIAFHVTRSSAKPEYRYLHVRQWILSFGKHCRVLEPPELRDFVLQDHREALEQLQTS